MLKNAKTLPEVWYGLHFAAGLAEYAESGKEPLRILLEEQTIKNMNPSFVGKPVYVEHVEGVDLENIQEEADGYVVDSFWNSTDGKCWCKFIVVSDQGKQAIRSGFKLSNAYIPTGESAGGMWHGMPYQKEITAGVYEHLALVRNPRYEESMILNADDFKEYNSKKEIELKRLANSKDEPKGEQTVGLKFFKRAKVENSIDLESTVVELPSSKKEMTISELVTAHDKIVNMHGYASDEHMVKMDNGDEMSVGEMKKKHMEACNELESMKKDAISEDGGEPGKGADDDQEMNSEASVSEDMSSVGDRGGDKSLDNAEEDEEVMKKKEMKKNEIKKKVNSLRTAHLTVEVEAPKVFLNSDKVALGKSRYGSN